MPSSDQRSTRHGKLDAPLVVDPTYYSFGGYRPQLYVGHGFNHDPGGNMYRLQTMGPPPSHEKGEEEFRVGEEEMSKEALTVMNQLLGHGGPMRTREEMRYLCNVSLLAMRGGEEEIFRALVEAEGFNAKAWIPETNWKIVFES